MAILSTVFLLSATVCVSGDALQARECQEGTSSVTITRTRLRVDEVSVTLTRLDLRSRYVTLTTTQFLPSTVTQIALMTLFVEPLVSPATEYVTELQINEKLLLYIETIYVQKTIATTHAAWDVENVYESVTATDTLTSRSTVTLVETVTRTSTESLTRTLVDVSTSLTYVPLFVSVAETNVFPLYQRSLA